MKKLLALLMAVMMILALSACGAQGEPDPNLGLYEGKSAEMWGIEIDITEMYEQGFNIELKSNGKCRLEVDGTAASGKWTLDGTAFTVEGGGFEGSGTLSEGVIVLENVLDSGVNITFVNASYPNA